MKILILAATQGMVAFPSLAQQSTERSHPRALDVPRFHPVTRDGRSFISNNFEERRALNEHVACADGEGLNVRKPEELGGLRGLRSRIVSPHFIRCSDALRVTQFRNADDAMDYFLRLSSLLGTVRHPSHCLRPAFAATVQLAAQAGQLQGLRSEMSRLGCSGFWAMALLTTPIARVQQQMGRGFRLSLDSLDREFLEDFLRTIDAQVLHLPFASTMTLLTNAQGLRSLDPSGNRAATSIAQAVTQFNNIRRFSVNESHLLLTTLQREFQFDLVNYASSVSVSDQDLLERALPASLNLTERIPPPWPWTEHLRSCFQGQRITLFEILYLSGRDHSTRAQVISLMQRRGSLPSELIQMWSLDQALHAAAGTPMEVGLLQNLEDSSACAVASIQRAQHWALMRRSDADSPANLRNTGVDSARFLLRLAEVRLRAPHMQDRWDRFIDHMGLHEVYLRAVREVSATRDLENLRRALNGQTLQPYRNGRVHGSRPLPEPTFDWRGGQFRVRPETTSDDYALLDQFEALPEDRHLPRFALDRLLARRIRGASRSSSEDLKHLLTETDQGRLRSAKAHIMRAGRELQRKDHVNELAQRLFVPEGQELKYNLEAASLLDYIERQRFQCLAGTELLLSLWLASPPTATGSDVPVVVFTAGHVLPGVLRSHETRGWELVGIESTRRGQALVPFGPTSDIQIPMVVVPVKDYFVSELLSHTFVDPQLYQDAVMRHMQTTYGFRSFARPGTPLSFAFGRLNIPPGDQALSAGAPTAVDYLEGRQVVPGALPGAESIESGYVKIPTPAGERAEHPIPSNSNYSISFYWPLGTNGLIDFERMNSYLQTDTNLSLSLRDKLEFAERALGGSRMPLRRVRIVVPWEWLSEPAYRFRVLASREIFSGGADGTQLEDVLLDRVPF